jgi:hypothetical protein
MKNQAENYFHCKDGNYNCAQAVLKAFQKEFNLSDDIINEYKKYGGGRADGNLCGALFAAMQLLHQHPEKAEFIKKEFAKIAGSTKCQEILKSKSFACRECVKLAAELLEKAIEKHSD